MVAPGERHPFRSLEQTHILVLGLHQVNQSRASTDLLSRLEVDAFISSTAHHPNIWPLTWKEGRTGERLQHLTLTPTLTLDQRVPVNLTAVMEAEWSFRVCSRL